MLIIINLRINNDLTLVLVWVLGGNPFGLTALVRDLLQGKSL